MSSARGAFTTFSNGATDRWGIVRRQPIYEKDRMDPVDPAATLRLDPDRLGPVPGGIPSPRVPAVVHRLRRQGRPPGSSGAGSWKLCTRKVRRGSSDPNGLGTPF